MTKQPKPKYGEDIHFVYHEYAKSSLVKRLKNTKLSMS